MDFIFQHDFGIALLVAKHILQGISHLVYDGHWKAPVGHEWVYNPHDATGAFVLFASLNAYGGTKWVPHTH